jgi:mRNA interferase RelE/StbE
MPYTIKIKRQAGKKLASISKPEREAITEKITALGQNPDDDALDTKKLAASRYWRLRVGSWRVIYDRHDDLKIIAIEKIKPRGDAYK